MLRIMRYFISVLFILTFVMTGCRHKGADRISGGDTLTVGTADGARYLTLVDFGDYAVADISDPFTDGREVMERYILVRPEADRSKLPEGTVVSVPLKKSVVFSSVYSGAVSELGALDAIAGVADGQYFSDPVMKRLIASGRIADVGSGMSPSAEKIVDLDADAVIVSPTQTQDLSNVSRIGIPVVKFYDYMESTPLGRAEWIKLIGYLYGAYPKADSIYDAVSSSYRDLADRAAGLSPRPGVITEMPYSGVWNMPAGESYMARMLADAGADYVWASTEGTGSLNLDAAAVLDKGADADFWIIRSFGPLTLSAMAADLPVSRHIKAWQTGGVFVSDTSVKPLFDEFPFHPDRLLSDYIRIFHPDTDSRAFRYFAPAQ